MEAIQSTIKSGESYCFALWSGKCVCPDSKPQSTITIQNVGDTVNGGSLVWDGTTFKKETLFYTCAKSNGGGGGGGGGSGGGSNNDDDDKEPLVGIYAPLIILILVAIAFLIYFIVVG